jgi:hypothetical protein
MPRSSHFDVAADDISDKHGAALPEQDERVFGYRTPGVPLGYF